MVKLRPLERIFSITNSGTNKLVMLFGIPIKIDRTKFFKHKPIVDNKIVIDNYMGKGYGCNSKYVAEKLLEMYPNKFDIVWVVSDKDKEISEFPVGIRTVKYGSVQAIYEYLTAKIWLSNYHKISYLKKGLIKRKRQYFIQMWHGSLGIKKIENDVPLLTTDNNWLNLAEISSNMVDYWISNSSFETEIYKRAFWNVKKVIEYGHPRNDIFFTKNKIIKKKVREYFDITEEKIAFYAPTFREDYNLDCYKINFKNLLNSLSNKFGGKWALIVRLHPRVRKYSAEVLGNNSYIYDGTNYSDIQELMYASDVMLTDYSSCIFDFMLSRKPGFIFATDIEQFNTDRGFYYPLESTPFPIATNNYELIKNIENFDYEKYKQKVEEFLKDKGCMEDGHASERVVDLIEKIMSGEVDE